MEDKEVKIKDQEAHSADYNTTIGVMTNVPITPQLQGAAEPF
jgi:hypothetical protein